MSKKNVEWEWKKLGDVCVFLDSKRVPITKKNRVAGKYPYYGATGLLDYVSDFIFDEKLVLLGEDGAKWGAGDISAYSIEGKTWVNNHAHVLRPNRTLVNDDWIIYYLVGTDLQSYVTGLTVPKLNQEKSREIQLPIPPLDEQERIVKVLDDAFEKIDAIKTTAETNLQNAKDFFDSALTKELNVKKNILCQMKEVCDVRDGTHDSPKYQKIGHPLVTSKNLKDGKVNFEKIKLISEEDYIAINKRSKVNIGDVLFAMIGTIGNPVLITEEPNYAIKNMALFKPKEQLDSSFLQLYLNSPKVLEKMNKEANGSTQRFVGLDYLRNFQIPLPPLPIQKQIVAKLDSLSEKVKQLESNYKQVLVDCDELKKAILKKAFNGEL